MESDTYQDALILKALTRYQEEKQAWKIHQNVDKYYIVTDNNRRYINTFYEDTPGVRHTFSRYTFGRIEEAEFFVEFQAMKAALMENHHDPLD